MPSACASRARSPVGAASHISAVTTTSSIATDARLCQRKIVWVKSMMPPGTRPPAATMSRTRAGSAFGVAICSAAEPDSPCAQTLPRPSRLAAASAR